MPPALAALLAYSMSFLHCFVALHPPGSRGVKLVADALIDDAAGEGPYDCIACPGGMPGAERLRDCASLAQLVVQQRTSGRLLAAICATPAVFLQPAGLIDGATRATAHPAFSAKLPNQEAVERRVVIDGSLTTSRGPGTTFEFALALVAQVRCVALLNVLTGNVRTPPAAPRPLQLNTPPNTHGLWARQIRPRALPPYPLLTAACITLPCRCPRRCMHLRMHYANLPSPPPCCLLRLRTQLCGPDKAAEVAGPMVLPTTGLELPVS